MHRYAQINKDGYVVCDSFLSGEVENALLICIEDDFNLKNKKYVDGVWVEYEPEPKQPQAPEPDNYEIYNNQLLLMEAMATQYEEQQAADISSMEVQATIYEAVLGIKEGGTENG